MVKRCTHKQSGKNFALKIIDTRPFRLSHDFDEEDVLREVKIMARLSHPNIVQLEDVYITSQVCTQRGPDAPAPSSPQQR